MKLQLSNQEKSFVEKLIPLPQGNEIEITVRKALLLIDNLKSWWTLHVYDDNDLFVKHNPQTDEEKMCMDISKKIFKLVNDELQGNNQ